MSMLEWAKREVEIACKNENPDRKEGEFDYGCACYEGALKAFETLCNQGHSGMSIKFTQHILNRLIDGRPLKPIEDTPDVWNDITELKEDGTVEYQCNRMSSLFKKVRVDGSIEYTDVDRVYGVDIHNSDLTYKSGLLTRIINEMFPIKMPYMPASKSYKFVTTDFLVDPKNGDFDTMALFTLTEPSGEKTMEVNRYFRAPEEGEEETYPGWVEISEDEYTKRVFRAGGIKHYHKSEDKDEIK